MLNIGLPYDSAILHQIYHMTQHSMPKLKPREMKIHAHTKFLYMNVHSGLFIIAPKWTQPKYPSTDY